MSSPVSHRLRDGGLIDRETSLSFTFDGLDYSAHPGDTLASALLANGVRLMGRSFKYHRPRGVFASGSAEPNALVTVGQGAYRDPNTRATVVEMYDGLHAESQNRFPSLKFDLMAVNGWLSPFLGAGFYYKTFMWPAAFWEKLYEPLIRRAAGLGALSGAPDPDQYEKGYFHCDILVIGAGPAGLMAALTAARSGLRVAIADEDFAPGGELLNRNVAIGGVAGHAWAASIRDELEAMSNVRYLARTTVFGCYDSGTYGLLERVTEHQSSPATHLPRQRLWKAFTRSAILCTGATERPIAFSGNDRPGVMMAGTARGFANRQAVAVGGKVAVFTNNDDGWRAAADLSRSGTTVSALIDVRTHVSEDLTRASAELLGDAEVLLGAKLTRARGGSEIYGVDVVDLAGRSRHLNADAVAVSGGWNPNIQLTCHLGNKPVWRDDITAFGYGEDLPPGMICAGSANGRMSDFGALSDGASAAQRACEALGHSVHQDVPEADDSPTTLTPFWFVEGRPGDTFLDMQNDVTLKDIEQSHLEGFRAAEHVKRYTTLGMATDQGKTANVLALAVSANLTGAPMGQTGTTTARPPYTPVSIAAFAGRSSSENFRPTRHTPSHGWAVEQGAAFVETGMWLRAQWYPRGGETHWRQSVDREVIQTRGSVGICDVTTLGKIDIQGADAARFLDAVYSNMFSTLKVGRARYGLMLREDGFVMDDGTTARLGENHYVMTTTTANAVGVFRHLEFCRQVLWREMDVHLISVTDQWAQFAVAGPQSRALLEKVVDHPESISNEAFPFMGAMSTTVCGGLPARLFRLSFSGELAYEIAVPSRYGDGLVRALMDAGKDYDAVAYGTEALGVMRVEKGHAAGNELNGTTTAADLGLGRMVSKKKDCIGKVMSMREGLTAPDRPTLVGFKPLDPSCSLNAGAHFIGVGRSVEAKNDEGYMTSVCYSPSLESSIGLGFIRHGPQRLGETVIATDLVRDKRVEVEICSPHFIDPQGDRLRG